MKRSKAVMLGLVLAVAVVLAARPTRAAASDTAMWVGVGIGAYILLLATATIIAFPNPAPFSPDLAELPDRDADPDPLRFAGRCQQSGPSFVVACW